MGEEGWEYRARGAPAPRERQLTDHSVFAPWDYRAMTFFPNPFPFAASEPRIPFLAGPILYPNQLQARPSIRCSFLPFPRNYYPREAWFRRGYELDDQGVGCTLLEEYPADMEHHPEADALPKLVLEKRPEYALTYREYDRALIRNNRPDREQNLERA